jgi:hypothetical protein
MALPAYTDVEDAITAILEGLNWSEPINFARLARERGVPYQRLIARAKGRQSKCERPGPNKLFTAEEEESIHIYLQSLDNIGTNVRL